MESINNIQDNSNFPGADKIPPDTNNSNPAHIRLHSKAFNLLVIGITVGMVMTGVNILFIPMLIPDYFPFGLSFFRIVFIAAIISATVQWLVYYGIMLVMTVKHKKISMKSTYLIAMMVISIINIVSIGILLINLLLLLLLIVILVPTTNVILILFVIGFAHGVCQIVSQIIILEGIKNQKQIEFNKSKSLNF